jgi:hypothetical protein
MLAMSDSVLSRRRFTQLLAGGVGFCAGEQFAFAGEARIDRLISQARAYGQISQRIDFISRALRGTIYQGYTLIGGPRRAEKFVVRDDAFDCVTFCETVLAAAIAREASEFEPTLRAIRYHNGDVTWRERNHYFFEWSQHNIENKTCRPIVMDGSVEINKTVFWHKELGKRRFAMAVIPLTAFLANRKMLANGDIVGFVTQRPNLDYFHIGFVAFGSKSELLLRHASQSHHRVLDERMETFAGLNYVRYVTLLRPEEPESATATKKDG